MEQPRVYSKTLPIAVIVSCVITIASLFVMDLLPETFAMIPNVGIFLSPVLAIIWFFYTVFFFKQKNWSVRVLNLACLVIIGLSVYLFLVWQNTYTAHGYFIDIEKAEKDSQYYIVLHDRTFEVDAETYHMIVDGQWYEIKYRYNEFTGSQKLLEIAFDYSED